MLKSGRVGGGSVCGDSDTNDDGKVTQKKAASLSAARLKNVIVIHIEH